MFHMMIRVGDVSNALFYYDDLFYNSKPSEIPNNVSEMICAECKFGKTLVFILLRQDKNGEWKINKAATRNYAYNMWINFDQIYSYKKELLVKIKRSNHFQELQSA